MPIYQILIFAFVGLGLLDTIYLTYHAITHTDVACWWFPKEWCHKVQYSPQSKTFGIPNPYLGLGMYLAILVMMLLFLKGVIPFWPISAIVAFGFAFSMYFIYVQAFVLKAFCTWCVVSALNFTVLFLSVFALK
jgi:uncharacterized membrane protein